MMLVCGALIEEQQRTTGSGRVLAYKAVVSPPSGLGSPPGLVVVVVLTERKNRQLHGTADEAASRTSSRAVDRRRSIWHCCLLCRMGREAAMTVPWHLPTRLL